MNKPKTKVVCTIGPSSWEPEVLKKMFDNGMTIARVNGAFPDLAELERVGNLIRSISEDISLMLDIKGTQVRLNKFEGWIDIKEGDELVIGNSDQDRIYPITYPELARDLKVGDNLMMDDGKIKVEVTKIEEGKIYTKVKYGTKLLPGKPINAPGIKLTNPPITPRDIEQVKFAIEKGWDFVAGSFIRNAEDIAEIQKHLEGTQMKIFAKIEDTEGVKNIEEIIDACYGIIIARGDMAVEMPYQKIPFIQKDIVQKCLAKAKPVIVATQMLESMTASPNPTRAEINDVANSVLDGADSVWLSAETSTGKYPIESVNTLATISNEAEDNMWPQIIYSEPDANPVNIATARGIIDICDTHDVDKIIIASPLGEVARILSSYKPDPWVIVLTKDKTIARQLEASWGVLAKEFDNYSDDRDINIKNIVEKAIELELVKADETVVVARSTSKEIDVANAIEVGVAGDLIKS